MKKMIAMLISLVLVFLCGAAVAENMVGMPNPMVEVESTEEMAAATGIWMDASQLMLEAPEMVAINSMGQISFTLKNVNDEDVIWTLRFTQDSALNASAESFAGIYDEKLTKLESIEMEWGTLLFQEAKTLGYSLYFWNLNGIYYALSISGTYSQMQFAAVMDRVEAMMQTASLVAMDGQNPVMNLVGEYWDSYSQRANMTIEAGEGALAKVTIRWGSSAFETSEWRFTGTFNQDTMEIPYEDCVLVNEVYDMARGEMVETIIYDNGTGKLSIQSDNSILWQDNVENAGEHCCFEYEYVVEEE